MFDQTSIALAGTAVRRVEALSRYEDRVARPRHRSLRRTSAEAQSVAPPLAGTFALQC